MVVYLINETNSDRYKIGITKKDVNKRLKQLQTSNPNELWVVHEYKTDYANKLEKVLHNFFRVKKLEGEWFLLNDDDVLNFKDICIEKEKVIEFMVKNNDFFK